MPFPRIPHGDIISVVPRFVNSVSGPDRWGVLKFNSLRQFLNLEGIADATT
jgi:hypothetical protein